jgi:hypothetical protein
MPFARPEKADMLLILIVKGLIEVLQDWRRPDLMQSDGSSG